MRLNPTTLVTSDDWLVEIVCIGWDGREYRKRIGVSARVKTEQQAVWDALNSLRKHGQFPPEIKQAEARRRYKVGVEKTISQAQQLYERFVKTS